MAVSRSFRYPDTLHDVPDSEHGLAETSLALHFPRGTIWRRQLHIFDDGARSAGENKDSVSQEDGFLHRVRYEEHGGFLFSPKTDQQVLHVEPRQRIKRAEWFVH